MARGIVRLDPRRVLEDAGLAGYEPVGATFDESGRLILVVEGGDRIPALPKQLSEVPVPGAGSVPARRNKKKADRDVIPEGHEPDDDEDNQLNDLQLK